MEVYTGRRIDTDAPVVMQSESGAAINNAKVYVRASDDVYSTDLYFSDEFESGMSSVVYSTTNSASINWDDLEEITLDKEN
ncbi:MAG: hypothetical protein K6B67_03255 [Lachnospiraceae bacterium]|nr:hypothetical protein [Lachnospiraceae bacterium]